jgi:diguanylate cyclase (GGDEF)-like protein/PAS domain S-box-containing protein
MRDAVVTGFLISHSTRRRPGGSRFSRLLRAAAPAWARPAGEGAETLRSQLEAARAELTRRDSFLSALLETVDVGIIFCGVEGTDWTRNRAGRQMLGLDPETRGGLDPMAAASRLDILDARGEPVRVEDYPLARALRGDQTGAVELLVGPSGGPHREVVTLNSQIIDARGVVLGAVSALTDVSAERAAVRRAGEQSRMLVEAQRIGQIGSFELDLGTGRWSYSEELLALWGLTTADSVDLSGPLGVELVHPEDREATRAAWTRACQEGGTLTWEHRIVRSDGEERRVRATVEAELGPDGVATRVRGTNLDITELTTAKTAAQAASDFNHAVLTASPDYTFVTDLATGAVVYGSRGRDILGITFDELAALGPELLAELVHPDDVDELRALNVEAAGLEDGAVLQVRYRGRHANGEWRWLSRRVTPFTRDASGAAVQVVGVMRDITDTVLAEQRLQHAALHDGLTGLPNRTQLMQRLQDSLDRSALLGGEVTVLFCDLDGFKLVNDSAGHAAGDAVLQVTGQRIEAILREGDTVARVGGDEFVVVLEPRSRSLTAVGAPDQDSRDRERAAALQIATRITNAVRRPVRHDGEVHGVTASIGMTFASAWGADGTDRVTADTVLRRADDLMYRAKARGKDRVEVLAVS